MAERLGTDLRCVMCGELIGTNGHAPGQKCPHVRAIVYRKDNTIKRVEFFSPRERHATTEGRA